MSEGEQNISLFIELSYNDGAKMLFTSDVSVQQIAQANIVMSIELSRWKLPVNVPTVSTRLCFGSKGITELIGFLKRLKLLTFLKYRMFRRWLVSLLRNVIWGKEICV